jgi:hypothetical protein
LDLVSIGVCIFEAAPQQQSRSKDSIESATGYENQETRDSEKHNRPILYLYDNFLQGYHQDTPETTGLATSCTLQGTDPAAWLLTLGG